MECSESSAARSDKARSLSLRCRSLSFSSRSLTSRRSARWSSISDLAVSFSIMSMSCLDIEIISDTSDVDATAAPSFNGSPLPVYKKVALTCGNLATIMLTIPGLNFLVLPLPRS